MQRAWDCCIELIKNVMLFSFMRDFEVSADLNSSFFFFFFGVLQIRGLHNGLDDPGIESWLGARFSAHVQTDPGGPPSFL
jgi:hypothetical protein